MKSSLRALALLTALTATIGLAGAANVDPGSTLDLKTMAFVSPCETDATLAGDAPMGAGVTASCDETAGTLDGSASLDEVMVPYAVNSSAVIQYLFEVGSTDATMGNMINGALSYDLSWADLLGALPLGTASVALEIEVFDVTDDMAPPLSLLKQGVHSRGIFCDGAALPECDGMALPGEGMDSDIIPLMLKRGGAYMVTVRVLNEATTGDSAEAQFASAGITAAVNALDVAVQVDLAELAAQVAANTAAIAALESSVETLSGQISDLQDALDALGEVVANHTHKYLTGRGVGHNNTEVETSPPVSDDEPTPEPQFTRPGSRRGNEKDKR